MEKMIKKTKLLLYICLAMFLLNSCTEEKEYLENGNRDIKTSKKSFKELMLLNDFSKAYKKVAFEKQRNLASRTALEEQYNFTIAEDKEVNVVEIDGKTFYNLLIRRDASTTAFFENLLIKTEIANNQEEASAYIVKYFTPNDSKYTYGNDKEITQLYGKITIVKRIVCVTLCHATNPAHPLPHSPYCDACYSHLQTQCWEYYEPSGEEDNGGGGNSNTGTTTSGGGGGGDGSSSGAGGSPPPQNGASAPPDEELELLPVEEEEEEDVNKIPCEQLYRLCQKTNIKTAINQIGVTTEDDEEHGYSFVKNGSNYSANELLSGYDNSIKVPTGSDKIGGIHCHRDRDFGMFTWQDLLVLYYSYKNTDPLNRREVTYMLSCSAGVYALKITDWIAFRAMINPVIGILDNVKREKVIEDKNDELGKTFESNIPSSNLEVDLLLYLKNNNAGVSLFKANTDFSPSTTVTWNKISLNDTNPSSLTTTTEPCNP